MVRFQLIVTSDVQYYKFVGELLVESFPPEEYRELGHLHEYTDQIGNFHNDIIFDGDLPIDLTAYWDFGEFCYVEHSATNPALRNRGYGKRTLRHLCKSLKRPIILEVECPAEEMAKRHINFYQRHGFTLWEKDYYQSPYKEGDDFLPMYLMIHGNLDTGKDYEEMRHKLHTIVYGIKE